MAGSGRARNIGANRSERLIHLPLLRGLRAALDCLRAGRAGSSFHPRFALALFRLRGFGGSLDENLHDEKPL